MNGKDGHDAECPRDRCSYCGEAYPLDTAEVIRGKAYCSDCAHEEREAERALDARDCRNINFYDGGDFNYGRGR